MTLLRAFDLTLSFGSRTLFSNLELVIEEGERVGLVGVNGCGKSTLMKVLTGEVKADTGTMQVQKGMRVSHLAQEPSFTPGATPASELAVAQQALRDALDEYAQLSESLQHASDDKVLARLSALGETIEHLGGWDTAHESRKLLDRLGVDPATWDQPIETLSGGQKKRVAIARALLTHADLLMFDEPTNHLDAETVEWLEEEIDSRDSALLLVTHDRYFLDGLVDRIVEVEPHVSDSQPGGLISYPGNYEAYLEQKFVSLENQKTGEHKRQQWIAQEVAWLRRGPKARRTKSKARIERARKLLSEKGFQRPRVPELQLAAAPRLSQTVIEAAHLKKSFGELKILDDVNVILQPGERIGLVGKNGAGKTTLIKTLLGEIPPDSGTVRLGPKTRVVHYDQLRTALDEEKTVFEAAWDDDWVTLGEKKMRLAEYLDDLLFPVPMQRMKVKGLSGGERNRLLLARLFLEGANVLVLDEPTNDLDLVTLNVLERLLMQFSGAVLLVTHDRYFLDKVATALLVFEGEGKVVRYEGNYDLYRRLTAGGKKGSAPQLEGGLVAAPEKSPRKGKR
ncbi:MAG: ABC-F family ATP-binding cassette domain-containing protein [Myxococcales bacterium]|nr:ABC-F family ATP-binding cassette domain-containing protein [Myxococcales bacterium]